MITSLHMRPLGITEDETFGSNKSVKGAVIKGIDENLDSLKFIKGKDNYKMTCLSRIHTEPNAQITHLK